MSPVSGAVVDPLLSKAFGGVVPERERVAWERLTTSQRARTAQRLSALLAWSPGQNEVEASAAAEMAGVSLSRFYSLASDWRANPSLGGLGTFAAPLSRRSKFDPHVINRLQSKVPNVVRLNGGASVSEFVEILITEAQVGADKLPGTTKLREIVQDELRRIAATHDAGTAVVLDCVAVSLRRADGRPHVMFACVDRGSRAILGVSVGSALDSISGHAAAARDALITISTGRLKLPFGHRLTRVEITAGADLNQCRRLVIALNKNVGGVNFQLTTRPNRYGRYLRTLVGPRIGRIVMTPTRTETGSAAPTNGDTTPWSDSEVLLEIHAATEAYNTSLTAEFNTKVAETDPPQSLIKALEEISKAEVR